MHFFEEINKKTLSTWRQTFWKCNDKFSRMNKSEKKNCYRFISFLTGEFNLKLQYSIKMAPSYFIMNDVTKTVIISPNEGPISFGHKIHTFFIAGFPHAKVFHCLQFTKLWLCQSEKKNGYCLVLIYFLCNHVPKLINQVQPCSTSNKSFCFCHIYPVSIMLTEDILEICKVPESSNKYRASFLSSERPFLYQRIIGFGSPVAWQRNRATASSCNVWLIGPNRIIGGGRRSLSGKITSFSSEKCARNGRC